MRVGGGRGVELLPQGVTQGVAFRVLDGRGLELQMMMLIVCAPAVYSNSLPHWWRKLLSSVWVAMRVREKVAGHSLKQ